MSTSIRVLHVDDEPAVAELTAEFLERRHDGFEVAVETDAATTLDHLETGAFDCVVSDYEMPETNGIDLLREVRHEYPDLPFVLFTGRGSEEVASEAISAGVTDYLQKGEGPDQYTLLANRIGNAVERHRSTQQARETERQLSLLAENVDDVVFLFGPGMAELLFVNSAYEEVWGRSAAALEGDPLDFLEGVHPGDRERVRKAVDELSDGGETELTFRVDADGEYGRWVWARATRARLESGTERYIWSARDVTDQVERDRKTRTLQRVVEDLVRAESREEIAETAVGAAADVFSLSLSGIHLLNGDGTALEPVAVTEAVRDAVDGPPVYRRDDETQPATLVWDSLERGETADVPDSHDRGDLSVGDVPIRSGIVHPLGGLGVFVLSAPQPETFDDADRALVEVLASIVTAALDRVDREEAIRAERDRFAALFEMVTEPVVEVRIEGGVPVLTSVNEAFESTFGYPAEEVVGRPVNDVIVPPEGIETAHEIDARAQEGERITREVRRQTAEGVRDFLFQSAPVEGGGLREQFGIYVDIHEQKMRERQLARQNEQLDEFAAVVSHDLRSPLNVATGWLDLAREECDCEHLARVAAAHDRIDRIVDDVLTLARQGRVVREPEPVSLTAVVERAVETTDLRTAEVVLGDLPTVCGDAERFQEALENLLRNSVEHAGPSVTVTVDPLADGFSVADDGPGIPPGERDRVFHRGYSTVDDGTGFGLNIVRRIVEAHGWEIAVTGSDDGGARFEITGVDVVEE